MGERCLFEHVAETRIDAAALEAMPVEAVAALRIFWVGVGIDTFFQGIFLGVPLISQLMSCGYLLLIKNLGHRPDPTQTSHTDMDLSFPIPVIHQVTQPKASVAILIKLPVIQSEPVGE
ncbi:MAG: hypothetical protein NTX38_15475 [Methylobacter sp.]|nr:hypothetical protein [Methylobacter sp.]